ncbi:outer membrane beta-barrel protein [Psychroserpens sp. MEBiC05023]
MKKLLLMAAVAVFGFTNVNAQDDNTTGGFAKDDVYASGTVGFSNTKVADFKSNEFTFMPAVGYFISDNIALEANLIIASGEDFSEDKSSTFGAGLGATYFFTPASQFSFTVGAGVAYTNTKFEPNGGDETKINSFAIAVAPGVNYFVSDCLALRASIGALSYSSAKEDTDGAEAANTFALNLDLTDINLGIVYKF